VINCAAYTAVDKAEEEKEKAEAKILMSASRPAG
jgi:dTDP-4-dehydrorhamnose reductase